MKNPNVTNIIAAQLPPSQRPMAKLMVSLLASAILHGCETSGRVNVPGLGVFRLKQMPGRQVRNPKTGETMMRPAYRKMVFRPGKELKERIDAGG